MGLERYVKMFENKDAELHPELKPFLCEMEMPHESQKLQGWQVLKHPIIFAVPYHSEMNDYYNKSYELKKKELKKAYEENNWGSFIALHERPHRFEALSEIYEDISDQEYWEMLSWIWTDSENLWQQRDYVEDFLNSVRPGIEFMMDENETDLLASLPETFRIYRGHQNYNQSGYSWTLSFWRAQWFAQRYLTTHDSPRVSSALVHKDDVIALLLGRGEAEIVVEPNVLNIEEVEPVCRPSWMDKVYDAAVEKYILKKSGYHGPWHWDKVERNAIKLASLIPKADAVVLQLFAILHDCCREDDSLDPHHGSRAADFAQELYDRNLLKITKEQMEKLTIACRDHCVEPPLINSDPTIGACWDADRLDLIRVGVIPDPQYLSTKAAKQNIWNV